jgi:hypothetical protein
MLRIGLALGSEGLALGGVGNRRKWSIGTCLTEAGIEPGTVASESPEARRSYATGRALRPGQDALPRSALREVAWLAGGYRHGIRADLPYVPAGQGGPPAPCRPPFPSSGSLAQGRPLRQPGLRGVAPTAVSGHDSLQVHIDLLTGRVWLVPTSETATAEVAARNFVGSVFRGVGLPDTFVSDRDARFAGSFRTALRAALGASLIFVSPHYCHTTRKVERANGVIADVLRALAGNRRDDWPELVPGRPRNSPSTTRLPHWARATHALLRRHRIGPN